MDLYKSNIQLKIPDFSVIFINMKKCFEFFINHILRNEIDLLFGVDSVIVVNFIKYSTNNKSFTVDCKLLTTDPDLCVESFPVGMEHLVLEGWKYMGYKENINLTSSIDIK
jgi:hypothetical protein